MVDDARSLRALAEDIYRPVVALAAASGSLLVADVRATPTSARSSPIWPDGRQSTLASGSWDPCAHRGVEDLAYVALRGARRVIVVPR